MGVFQIVPTYRCSILRIPNVFVLRDIDRLHNSWSSTRLRAGLLPNAIQYLVSQSLHLIWDYEDSLVFYQLTPVQSQYGPALTVLDICVELYVVYPAVPLYCRG